MNREELLDCVPETARYRRQPLPDAQNALLYWTEAVERMVPLNDELWDRCAAGSEEPAAGCPAQPQPLDQGTLDAVHEVVDRNQPTLALLRQGVACGRLQVQPPTAPQLQAVRLRLRWLPNALGWLVAEALLPIDISHIERRRRAGLDSTRKSIRVRYE